MAALVIFALLGLAAGAEVQLSGEVDIVTSSLFVVETPPAPIKAPGHLRQYAKLLPPSVTVAAAIWAFFSKAHLETLATELGEEATEVAEQLHLPVHEPEQREPDVSSSRLGWFASVLLSLAAFSLAALAVHRRRGKAKAQDLPLLAEREPTVKRAVVQMFRISTEQPDEEPEPAHWKRMMSNLSELSDRPLELGNQTEVFRMQTQEVLSSHSGGIDAGEGSSDKPSCQQLSSSSQSSPSRQALPEAPEEAEQEEQAKQVEPLVQEQAEQPEEAKPKATQSDVAPHMAPVADHVEGASSQADPSTQIPQCGLASPPVANEPNSAAAFLPNVRDAHAAEQTVPDAVEQQPIQAQPSEKSGSDSSIIPPISIRRQGTAEPSQETEPTRGRGKVGSKTSAQFPSTDTPRRRGLNSSLIGAPADKIREIAGHLTSGQPPVYASRLESPPKKQSAHPSARPGTLPKARGGSAKTG